MTNTQEKKYLMLIFLHGMEVLHRKEVKIPKKQLGLGAEIAF